MRITGIRESDGQGAQWGQKQRDDFSGQGAAEEQLLQEAAWGPQEIHHLPFLSPQCIKQEQF